MATELLRWLNCLPVEADEIEAIAIHGQLCQLIAAHPEVRRADALATLERLLSAHAASLCEEALVHAVNVARAFAAVDVEARLWLQLREMAPLAVDDEP